MYAEARLTVMAAFYANPPLIGHALRCRQVFPPMNESHHGPWLVPRGGDGPRPQLGRAQVGVGIAKVGRKCRRDA